jgi:Cys-tRNA(Pro)/Cys-tRNA(Cys) deacylase
VLRRFSGTLKTTLSTGCKYVPYILLPLSFGTPPGRALPEVRRRMAKKLNSMRFLESQGVPYEVWHFPDTIHAADEVAYYLGCAVSHVYKTLVVMLPTGKPVLVLVSGERTIHLKRLAQALGMRQLRMATHREAEACTGLKVGGISALALPPRRFPVYIDRPAAALEKIFVSAGQRGTDLRLAVTDLVRVVEATLVEATLPQATAHSAADIDRQWPRAQ